MMRTSATWFSAVAGRSKSVAAVVVAVVVVLAGCAPTGDQDTGGPGNTYYPGPGEAWQSREPADVGMSSAGLAAAIEYANAHETSMPKDPGQYLRDRFAALAHQEIVGPTRERGGVNGIIVRHGYVIAEWGDTRRVDMNFSVTKSYLSTLAGLAHDRGLVSDLDQPVRHLVQDSTFESEHNASITWRHLLQQTSEWEGVLWDKPDAADRRRGVDRTLQTPGSFWEYNDVRVNLLAYALLHVWRQPLPIVLRDLIMDPIGASTTWRWYGYDTSWTLMDGARVQSVSGGGHWGGGIWASTRDHARFGYLFLRGGRWNDRAIVSSNWIDQATTPVAIQPNYGFMWWLNTDREQFPAAPATSYFALGAASTSVIWVDPDHDLVAVTRWIDGNEHVNEFMRLVLASLSDSS